jgi:hypothetical protein
MAISGEKNLSGVLTRVLLGVLTNVFVVANKIIS